MEIFKFGGASVKDANGVKNFLATLQKLAKEDVLIVISAMGKMTNAFEGIVKAYFEKEPDLQEKLLNAKQFHMEIVENLNFDQNSKIVKEIDTIFEEITSFFKKNNSNDYDYVYDQLVSKAEFLSTRICSAFLQENGMNHQK